jgi:hypothetical protein
MASWISLRPADFVCVSQVRIPSLISTGVGAEVGTEIGVVVDGSNGIEIVDGSNGTEVTGLVGLEFGAEVVTSASPLASSPSSGP